MRAKILVVDDEQDLLDLLEMSLSAEGYEVMTAASGAAAIEALRRQRPDLILLDIMLEDRSGLELTGQIKHTPETMGIPIILLTAKDTETDIVVGLRVGADDYVTKPFSTQVLVARIEAVLRRGKSAQEDAVDVLTAGPVRVQKASRHVTVEGRNVELTGGEYNILVALLEAGGAILSRQDLKCALGDTATGQKERIIDVHVAALRKKLGPPARRIVKTIHGLGYRINR
ncbi:MAG: response regulator transcription factor [Sedimentisphaerales bacterium]|nr:response regulator transcription factor [Sedimentisphaerales bacterium]